MLRYLYKFSGQLVNMKRKITYFGQGMVVWNILPSEIRMADYT